MVYGVKKYFKIVNEISTVSNIAYMNSTCDTVARTVRAKLNKHADFEVGEKLVCRKFLKENGYKYRDKFEFSITKVTSASIGLDNSYFVSKTSAHKYVVFNYCRTRHSRQGSSIDDRITTFDWNSSCCESQMAIHNNNPSYGFK